MTYANTEAQSRSVRLPQAASFVQFGAVRDGHTPSGRSKWSATGSSRAALHRICFRLRLSVCGADVFVRIFQQIADGLIVVVVTEAIAEGFHLVAPGLGYWPDSGDVHFLWPTFHPNLRPDVYIQDLVI